MKYLLILIVSLILLSCEQEKYETPGEEVTVSYFYNKALIYRYRAYAEYDSIKFWGCSSESYEEAKDELIDKIKNYINSNPTTPTEKVKI